MNRLLLILSFYLFSGFTVSTNIEKIRVLYEKVAKSESTLDTLITLTNGANQNAPEMRAYHGAGLCVKAKFLTNPYTKYTQCNKGLTLLNNVVSANLKNLEVRFVRLSVELNLPAVMPFSSHIDTDKEFIVNNISTSHANYRRIKQFMLANGNLTKAQQAKFL